jgi:hypothetical protein
VAYAHAADDEIFGLAWERFMALEPLSIKPLYIPQRHSGPSKTLPRRQSPRSPRATKHDRRSQTPSHRFVLDVVRLVTPRKTRPLPATPGGDPSRCARIAIASVVVSDRFAICRASVRPGPAAATSYTSNRSEEQLVLHIIGLVLVGLLVGVLGRLFRPGRDKMGLVMTMVMASRLF